MTKPGDGVAASLVGGAQALSPVPGGDDEALTSSVGSSPSCPRSIRGAGGDSEGSSTGAAVRLSLREACSELESMRRQLQKTSLCPSSSAGDGIGVGWGAAVDSPSHEQPAPPPARMQRRSSIGGAIRRASMGGAASSSPPPPRASVSYPSPTRKAFPAECLAIVRLMKGNEQCFDCGLKFSSSFPSDAAREENMYGEREALTYASVAFGTMLCGRCAYRHNAKYTEVSLIKSLEDGGWGIHEVIHLLEGGNGNMMDYVLGKQASRRRSSSSIHAERKGTYLGGPHVITDDDYDRSFDERYIKSKSVASYQKRLEKRVAVILDLTANKTNYPLHPDIPATIPVRSDLLGNDGAVLEQNGTPCTDEREEQASLQHQSNHYDPNASGHFATSEKTQKENYSAWESSWSSFPSAGMNGPDYDPMPHGYENDDTSNFLTVQEKIRRKREQIRTGSSARKVSSQSSYPTIKARRQRHYGTHSSQPVHGSSPNYVQGNQYSAEAIGTEAWNGEMGHGMSDSYYQEPDAYEQPPGHGDSAQQHIDRYQLGQTVPKLWWQSAGYSSGVSQNR